MTLERVLDRLDTLLDRQAEMNAILAKQETSLKEHIRRTDLLEAIAADQREELDVRIEALQAQLKPIETHVSMLRGAGKVAAAILSVIGVAAAIAKVIVEIL